MGRNVSETLTIQIFSQDTATKVPLGLYSGMCLSLSQPPKTNNV